MKQLNSFGISRYLKVPSLQLEWVPIVDILVIVFCLSLLSSKYIFSLGLSVDLPSVVDYQDVRGTNSRVVLTMAGADMVLYEGRRFSLDSFIEHMSTPEVKQDQGVILLRLNKGIDIELLVRVCGAVRRGGYSGVHIATQVNNNDDVMDF